MRLLIKFPYILVATTAWDYDKLQAHQHMIGDAAYHVSQIKGNMILKALEGYITLPRAAVSAASLIPRWTSGCRVNWGKHPQK